MRIAIGVHGRLHAFPLGEALAALGHDVTVFTNYPEGLCDRFGLNPSRVRSFVPHAALARLGRVAMGGRRAEWFDRLLHESFGRWLGDQVRGEGFDVLHVFSSVAEEAFEALAGSSTLRSLVRGSAHIVTQARILEEEERRAGVPIERPGRWVTERELREYALCDQIVVLSRFAERSFLEEGADPKKVERVPPGVNFTAFSPTSDERRARRTRLLAGSPIHLLFAGNLTFQKGLIDLAAIHRQLPQGKYELRLVGHSEKEEERFLAASGLGRFVKPRVPEWKLREEYTWADVFLLPSVHDGFAVVLAQAAAAGLAIISTENTGAAEVLEAGAPGWVVPIRQPERFVERLEWCEANRFRLAEMLDRDAGAGTGRSWLQAGEELVQTWRRRRS